MMSAGSLAGTIYNDINGNGVIDGELGLINWTVELRDGSGSCSSSGNVIATTTTGAAGAYAFVNLNTGTYTVCLVVQPGWTQTTPNTEYIALVQVDGQSGTGLNAAAARTGERSMLLAVWLTAFSVVACTYAWMDL